jgi:alpha-1,6-mannosyltransferase
MEDPRGRIRSDAVAAATDAIVAAIAGMLAYGAAATLGHLSAAGGSAQTIGLQILLAFAGLAGAAAFWKRSGSLALAWIVAVGLGARLALLPWPPLQSNDLYRYLWDGRVLAAGIDPYVVAPDDARLAAMRASGSLYTHIDWNHVPTLYPPFDLALYTLGAWLGHLFGSQLVPLKALLLAGDVLSMALIAAFLYAHKLPLGRLALYAWNPLVIVEFALNGHEESWAIAFLLATILAFRAKKTTLAAVAIAGAVLAKLYPAAFVPALFARRSLAPKALLVPIIVAAAYAPFLIWNPDVLGFLHTFAFAYHFNDSLHLVLGTFGASVFFALALVVAGIARYRGAKAIVVVLGCEIAYLLLSPNVYPWYVAVFAALLPLLPDAFAEGTRPLALALVAWTVLAPLAYLAPWIAASGSTLDNVAHVVEYVPIFVALAYGAFVRRRRIVALLAGAAALSGCAAAPNAAIVARGEHVYASNCAVCHQPTATSFIGPDLTHIASRRSKAALAHHIATSVPGGTTFSPATVNSLVAYLSALDRARPRAFVSERSITK